MADVAVHVEDTESIIECPSNPSLTTTQSEGLLECVSSATIRCHSSYYLGSSDPQAFRLFSADRERASLTRHHPHVCLAMVGLPGRGKSFIARKVEVFMKWKAGHEVVKLFNVGKYRRTNVEAQESGKAAFFDPSNANAVAAREQAAKEAMAEMLRFFETGGEVGILDATNSTKERRDWIVRECHAKNVAVVFIESICDDPEVLHENFLNKVRHSPDFRGMTQFEAMADLMDRIQNYERVYETINDDSTTYIKLFNLQSKVMCNKAYGSFTKSLLPYLTAVHIAPRPIWLVRAGLPAGQHEDDVEERHNPCAENKIAPLSDEGVQFAVALAEFVGTRSRKYMDQIKSANPHHFNDCAPQNDREHVHRVSRSDGQVDDGAICKVMCSTLPRSLATCEHLQDIADTEVYAALNPLDKGVFDGMRLKDIEQKSPKFHQMFEADRVNVRFPGGESIGDLVGRLESLLIEAEQQTAPVLICSHVSTSQVLYAYFCQVPINEACYIPIDPYVVHQFRPLMGGTWDHKRFQLDSSGLRPELIPVSSSIRRGQASPKSPSVQSLQKGLSRIESSTGLSRIESGTGFSRLTSSESSPS
uniref:6-phosphofructo-2-kinase domain-containing protein n=1 Tax=Eutreptiella gymnastica TaxID=73025 RepID=A0A6U8IDL3_9EUGL|mmetsp:Transcript_60708/g.108283  ORF Transcript_60708/g.108283 Transcript_60708/m.108283 type:complete len:589 (+) Transcript_60708:107-1873(+)